MAFKKYISTTVVAELTGKSYEEIRNLAKSGVLPYHKSCRGHWRFNVDAVEEYFGIQINKPAEEVVRATPKVMPKAAKVVVAKQTAKIYQATPVGTRLMINEDDYQEIRPRI